MNKVYYRLLVLLIFTYPNICKSNSLNSILESSGIIPSSFHQSLSENIEIARPYYQDYIKKSNLEEFLNKNSLSQLKRYQSGKILFGEFVSNYVNDIGQLILESNPELDKNDFKFYVYKSPTTNAFSTYNGEIFINIGLLAQAKNEAEIAYIICHEIAHFTDRHLIKSHKHIARDKSKSVFLKHDHSLEFSRENELKADSIGLTYFINTDYNTANVEESFLTLLNSDKYHINGPVNFDDIFPEIQIPNSYKLGKVQEVKKDQFYYDKYHTHPNIGSRIERLNTLNLMFTKDLMKQDYIISKTIFSEMQIIVRKEQLRLLFTEGSYVDAIYLSYLLKPAYNDPNFFDEIIERSIYAIARHKNKKAYKRISIPYRMIVGERQSLHYSFKLLTRKQVNCIALKYFYNNYRESKDNKYLSYINPLISDFKTLNQLKLSDFHTLITDSLETEIYGGSSKLLTKRQIVEKQTIQSKFYKYLLINELKDTSLHKLINTPHIYDEIEITNVYLFPILNDNQTKDVLEETITEKFNSLILGLNDDRLMLLDNSFQDISTVKLYNEYCIKKEWVYQVLGNIGISQPLNLHLPNLNSYKSSNLQVHYSYYNINSKKTHYEIITISPVSGNIVHKQSFERKYKTLRKSDLLSYLRITNLLLPND